MSYPCGKIYADIKQGTDEWFAIKCGKISGSKMSEVMQEKKGTGYENYLADLACQRMTNIITASGFKQNCYDHANRKCKCKRDSNSLVEPFNVNTSNGHSHKQATEKH